MTPTPKERAKSIRLHTTTLDGVRVARLPDCVLTDIEAAIREAEMLAELRGARSALKYVASWNSSEMESLEPYILELANDDTWLRDIVAHP